MKQFIALLITFIITSCASIEHLTIETYTPAKITLPKEVKKILVVNNAAPQPNNIGHKHVFGSKKETITTVVSSKNALEHTVKAIATQIADQEFFEDVLIYHEPLRDSADFLLNTPLSAELVRSLCSETDCDAIISIDRLLFGSERREEMLPQNFFFGKLDARLSGTMRCYLPSRAMPVCTISITDSVEWEDATLTRDLLQKSLPPTEDALGVVGLQLSEKIHHYFVPHWIEKDRCFFTSSDSRWKEAFAFASANKWEKAASLWEHSFRQIRNKEKQTRAALNIALCNELNDDLNKSLEWIEVAQDKCKQITDEAMRREHTLFIDRYIEDIRQRIINKKQLDSL